MKNTSSHGGFFTNIYFSASTMKSEKYDYSVADYKIQTGDFRRYSYSARNHTSTFGDLAGFSNLIIDGFFNAKAVIGLNIQVPDKHAITLWGCDYNENNLITKIYFTDSDDGEVRLNSALITDDGTGIYLEDYFGKGKTRIYDFSMLSVAQFPPIPEPAAFGLLSGLGALALVASRRRRK